MAVPCNESNNNAAIFFPSLYYFYLALNSDIFVFLDDVQYSKQSWQARNRIRINNELNWISLPIKKIPLNTKIHDVQIDSSKVKQISKLAKTLDQFCGVKLFKISNEDFLFEQLDTANWKLSDFNVNVIKKICESFGANTQFYTSKEMQVSCDRDARLLQIVQSVGGTEYHATIGSKNYMIEDGLGTWSANQIPVVFQQPTAFDKTPEDAYPSILHHLKDTPNLRSKVQMSGEVING